jgi:predicted transposase YdaD
MLKIMEYHTTQNKTKELPIVYPIIFYNGKKQYSYSTNLLDLFANKELAKRILGLLAPIQLTALNQIVDDELKELINYCSLALTMKHIYDKDTGALLKIILQSTQRISNHVIAANAITYFTETRKIDIQDFRRIIDESDLPKDYKEVAMTLADSLRREGRQEGIQEGMQEGMQKGRQEGIQEGMQKGRQEGIQEGQSKLIKNLLATGMSIEQIAMAANLTTDEVEQLAIVDM